MLVNAQHTGRDEFSFVQAKENLGQHHNVYNIAFGLAIYFDFNR